MLGVGSRTCAAAVCLSALVAVGNSQNQTPPAPLPTVVAAAWPSYSGLALQAGIAGTVRLRVHTDGEKVQLVVVMQAPPLLGAAAQENLKTWRFAPHVPTSFDVTLRFTRIRRESPDPCGPKRNDPWVGPEAVSTFRFPAEIEIESIVDYVGACDPSETIFDETVSEIRGIVVCDCEGRRPVADAEVIVGESTGNATDVFRRARTDANGRFTVAAVRWGTNTLLVQKHGHFDRHYKVKFAPLPWYRPGDFEFELVLDAGADKPPPRRRASVIPTTVPFYPSAAREQNIDGEVQLRMSPGGDLTPGGGPAALLTPALEMARAWRVKKGEDAADLRFNYRLIDGDCLGGGPLVTMRATQTMDVVEVRAKRTVPCGAGKVAAGR
jgi:hypothetical protein